MGTDRRGALWALVLCIFGFTGAGAASAAGKLEISSQVDRSEITVGDRIVYTITVQYPENGTVELPSVLGNLGAFEVKEYGVTPAETRDGRVSQTWRFSLSTFTLGDFTLPPQRIDFMEGDGKLRTTHFTQPIEITVKRTSPEGAKTIADIADLADIPQAPPWGLIALGALLALAAGLWVWRSRRNRSGASDKSIPRLPPYEEALEHLSRLNATQSVRQNQARELCFALSEILRRYVSRRFTVNGLEATTEEFLQRTADLPVDVPHRRWLGDFCSRTDLVKFANLNLLETEANQLMRELREFLDATRPAPETPSASPSSKGVAQA